jgi:hypothetical protein
LSPSSRGLGEDVRMLQSRPIRHPGQGSGHGVDQVDRELMREVTARRQFG